MSKDYDAALQAAKRLLDQPVRDFPPEVQGNLMFPEDDTVYAQYRRAVVRNAATSIENGKPIHPHLRAIVAGFLRGDVPPSKRGAPKKVTEDRDIRITLAVELVRHEFGFNATRNAGIRNVKARESEIHSACSIVADALAQPIGESAVVAVWTRYKKFHRFK